MLQTECNVPADLRVPSPERQLERRPGGAEVVRLRQVLNACPRKLETLVITLSAVFSLGDTTALLPINRLIFSPRFRCGRWS